MYSPFATCGLRACHDATCEYFAVRNAALSLSLYLDQQTHTYTDVYTCVLMYEYKYQPHRYTKNSLPVVPLPQRMQKT